jgi:uncharacterized membrane protein
MGKLIRIFLLLFILTWCAGYSSLILSTGSDTIKVFQPVLNMFYNNVCHQDLNKTIEINGFHFFVCARCTGIYFGALLFAFAAVIFLKEIRIPVKMHTLSIILLLIDVIINNLFLVNYSRVTAFITGLIFGSIVFLVLLNLIENSFQTKNSQG